MKKFLKKYKYVFVIIFSIIVIFYLVLVWERYKFNDRIYSSIDGLSKKEYIIVFGAGLKTFNTPSDILADRIKTAVYLYNNGIGKKILFSGDSKATNHDEVRVMAIYAQKLGVNKEDIIVDDRGYDTYSTCYRAKNNLKINEAILVTQNYHINRALYICNGIGIDSVGVTSDLNTYKDINKFKFREFFAFIKSFFEINLKFLRWKKLK